MTLQEIKKLEHTQIISENEKKLHLHTDDGFTLCTIKKITTFDENDEEYNKYIIFGSNCYYFPVNLQEYPLYKVITVEEYGKLKELLSDSNKELTKDEKELIYKDFIN